jgi:ABC-type microcin C transport system permease subunit YejB
MSRVKSTHAQFLTMLSSFQKRSFNGSHFREKRVLRFNLAVKKLKLF